MTDAKSNASSARSAQSGAGPSTPASRDVTAWAYQFFGQNTAITVAIEQLFDDTEYGIEVFYNPTSLVHSALKPSHFDLDKTLHSLDLA